MANTLNWRSSRRRDGGTEDVEMVTLRAWRARWGFATTRPLISQMVPGEMIVRKDAVICSSRRAKDHRSHRQPVAILTDLAIRPTALTRRSRRSAATRRSPVSAKNSRRTSRFRQRRAPTRSLVQFARQARRRRVICLPRDSANNFAISACKVWRIP